MTVSIRMTVDVGSNHVDDCTYIDVVLHNELLLIFYWEYIWTEKFQDTRVQYI